MRMTPRIPEGPYPQEPIAPSRESPYEHEDKKN